MSFETEQTTAILEHAKPTAMIHDGVLADAGLSSAEIVRLVSSIDAVYMKREKDFMQSYVAPDAVRVLLADERTSAFEDMASLLARLKDYYKGNKAEQSVLSRISEDFQKLRNKQG
jgi:hypothetical protein